ncbi:MAG: UDP-glucose 4-epimerase GalE [bacterium]|nr:UDP-glucose 4-epimerase GalE [bacterium]
MILITGGAGYIGSHTLKLLANSGQDCLVFDNFSTGHRDFLKWGQCFEGDLRDPAALEQVFGAYPISAVIHFAAKAYVGESFEDPQKYYDNNVVGSFNLLSAMRNHGVDKIIFSSTCAIYGQPSQIPISEAEPPDPINPYGRTKRMIEQLLIDYQQAYGLNYAILRYFNAAGADPELEVGERHLPETHAIPLAIETALGQRESFSIFGDDYDTADGTCVRDYIHVSDLARAHQLALKWLLANDQSEIFNLGCNQGFSVKEMVQAVAQVSGRQFKVNQAPRRPGDPPSLISDYQKAQEVLGWKPEYTDLKQIIQSAWDWQQQESQRG